jgi:hypothetical protein
MKCLIFFDRYLAVSVAFVVLVDITVQYPFNFGIEKWMIFVEIPIAKDCCALRQEHKKATLFSRVFFVCGVCEHKGKDVLNSSTRVRY